MKTLIPIFSITIASVFMQNCTNRDEEIISNHDRSKHSQEIVMMRQDSAQAPEEILDPDPTDPPVRDGDNWRLVQNK